MKRPILVLCALACPAAALADAQPEWPTKAWRCVMERFYSPRTSLIYDFRTGEGEAGLIGSLPTPQEIKACQPCATGWSSGMEDSVLNGGPMLLAAVFRWEVTKDEEARRDGLKIFHGLVRCAEVSGIEGFVARSVSPVDGKSFFPNSSRDQYTLFVCAMWRFSRSEMAGDAQAPERIKARKLLVAVARFSEKSVLPENKYCLMRADGKPAYVSQMWTATPGVADDRLWLSVYGGIGPHEATRLPMFYAAAYSVTGDRHWREMELKYADQAIEMANGRWGEKGAGFAVFQAQVAQRLLYETETDPVRKAKYLALLRRWAAYAVCCADKHEKYLAAAKGNVYRYADDWRTLRKEPIGFYGESKSVWTADYEAVFEALREASEGPLNARLAPGVSVPARCQKAMDDLYGTLDYSRVPNVAGVIHALTAYWFDAFERRMNADLMK